MAAGRLRRLLNAFARTSCARCGYCRRAASRRPVRSGCRAMLRIGLVRSSSVSDSIVESLDGGRRVEYVWGRDIVGFV